MSTVTKVEATKAKSGFAKLPAQAQANDVAITRHGRIQAYVVSPDRYTSLVSTSRVAEEPLKKLEDEFEALVARMQGESHRRAVRALETLPLSEILAAGARSAKHRPGKMRGARRKARSA